MAKKKQQTVAAVAVRVHANVPGHKRRRAGHTFTVNPIHFAKGEVPEEVEADDYLVKKDVEVSEDQLVSAAPAAEEQQKATKGKGEQKPPEPTEAQKATMDELQKISGIGQKTAERLVLENGIDLDSLATADPATLGPAGGELHPAQKTAIDAYQAAVQENPDLPGEIRASLKAERIQES